MIGKMLGIQPLTGKEATKGEVLERISTVAVVHIAAHGKLETGEIVLAPNPVRKDRKPIAVWKFSMLLLCSCKESVVL